jgi:outer membrane protein
MNKFKLFLSAFALILTGSAMAQKTGYIKVDNVIALMPETGKIDSLIRTFQADSLQPRFNYTLSEYQRKDSAVNGKDSSKTPPAVRAKMRQEMQQDLSELQNWQQIVQQASQQKQDQLLEPLYRKAITAIQEVAKENGYTYVYTQDALIVAPPGDDLLPLVAKKLNLKLPPGLAQRAPASSEGPGTNNPQTKTKTKTKG